MENFTFSLMFEIKTELTKKKKERQKNTLNFFFYISFNFWVVIFKKSCPDANGMNSRAKGTGSG